MSSIRVAKTSLKWTTSIILFLQCQCIDFQNNPFFQNIQRIQSNQNLTNIYPNNPFFQALAPRKTVISTTPRPPVLPSPTLPSEQFASPDICGRPLLLSESIIPDNRTNEGYWPWMVALFYKEHTNEEEDDNFICGANLISRRYVISAGHCVAKLNKEFGKESYDMFAYLGLFDLSKRRSSYVQRKKIDKMYVHPNHKSGESSDSDISVLRLATPAEYTLFVRPICLWKWNPDLEYIVGSLGRVIGWEKDENKRISTNEPQFIDVPIASEKECRSSNIRFHYITSERTFCAGLKNNRTPCNRDGGTSLILLMKDGQKEKWFLRGVVSQSMKRNFRCDQDQYIVFTDVPQFDLWMKSLIENEDM